MDYRQSLKIKRRLKPLNSPRQTSPQITQVQDVGQLITFVQDCLKEKKNIKTSVTKFIHYIKKIDYKRMNFQLLSEQNSFFLMKTLNTWISQMFSATNKQMELAESMIFITQFYQFIVKVFNSQFKSYAMKIAYTYYLNNMAINLLRSKQYKNAIQYLMEASRLYQKQQISHPIYSIVFSNISTIYFLLEDNEKGENYIQMAIKIAKQIDQQYVRTGRTKQTQYVENINSLAHLYIIYLQLFDRKKEKKPKLLQIQNSVNQLVRNNSVKLYNRNWFIKYYLERKKRASRYEPITQFDSIFNINIKEFQLYSEIQPIKTQKKKERVVPISFNNGNGINNAIINGNNNINTSNFNNSKLTDDLLNDSASISRYNNNPQSNNGYSKQFLQRMFNLQKSQQLIIQRLKKLADISTKQQKSQVTQKKIKGIPKIIFKNTIFNMAFYDEGLVISDFSNAEEKISWDNLYHIIANLQKYQIFQTQFQLSSNQYSLSKILSTHLRLENNEIKILKKPIPMITMKGSSSHYQYQFHSVENRSFKILIKNNKTNKNFLLNGEFDSKSFQHYFKTVRIDQYKDQIKKKFSKFQSKKVNKNEYSLEIIKLKSQDRYLKKIDMEKDLKQIFKNLEKLLDSGKLNNNFGKILFKFDQQCADQFQAAYYLIIENQNELKYQLFLYPLNQFTDVKQGFYLNKIFHFQTIITEIGIKPQSCTYMQKQAIKHILCEINQININYITISNKIKHVINLQSKPIEVGTFFQKFYFNKYYRPITITILGFRKKCLGITIAFYNETSIDKDTYFIPFNDEWYDMTQQQMQAYLKKDSNILKMHLLCKLAKKINPQKIYDILKKYSLENNRSVLSLEKFLQLIAY